MLFGCFVLLCLLFSCLCCVDVFGSCSLFIVVWFVGFGVVALFVFFVVVRCEGAKRRSGREVRWCLVVCALCCVVSFCLLLCICCSLLH